MKQGMKLGMKQLWKQCHPTRYETRYETRWMKQGYKSRCELSVQHQNEPINERRIRSKYETLYRAPNVNIVTHKANLMTGKMKGMKHV